MVNFNGQQQYKQNFCPILTIFGVYRRIFIKVPNIKFDWNTSSGNGGLVHADGYDEAHSFNSFSSLSYDRSKASSILSSPYSAIYNFLFQMRVTGVFNNFNALNAELNPICYLLALLAHHFLHVSRIRVKLLTLRLQMSYIYIYIYIWSTYSWCF